MSVFTILGFIFSSIPATPAVLHPKAPGCQLQSQQGIPHSSAGKIVHHQDVQLLLVAVLLFGNQIPSVSLDSLILLHVPLLFSIKKNAPPVEGRSIMSIISSYFSKKFSFFVEI